MERGKDHSGFDVAGQPGDKYRFAATADDLDRILVVNTGPLGVLWIDLNEIGIHVRELWNLAGYGHGVPVLQHAARGQDQRELFINRILRRFLVMNPDYGAAVVAPVEIQAA